LAIGNDSSALTQSGTAIGTAAAADAIDSTAVGSGSNIAAAAEGATAIGAGSRVSAAGGSALGQGASVTASGAVALGQGAVADQANTVSIGAEGSERRLTHLAAGSAATDGVNVAQMQAGDAQVLGSARSYTDSRVQALDDRFTDLAQGLDRRMGQQDRRIDRQGAMGSAMMNMALNAAGSRSLRGRVAVGAGWQNGQQALSVGYGKQVGERASFSVGGAFSGNDRSAGVGFGIDL